MATYTTNYNLKKPAPEDFYDIADFNGNADIIDAVMKTFTQWQVGSYVGTGVSGSGNPNSIVCNFPVKMLYILPGSVTQPFIMFPWVSDSGSFYTANVSANMSGLKENVVTISNSGKTVSWYTTSGSSSTYARDQMNYSGVTYHWIAFG